MPQEERPVLTRIMARLCPRRTLRIWESELSREAARLEALAAHLIALYRQAGLPAPLAVAR